MHASFVELLNLYVFLGSALHVDAPLPLNTYLYTCVSLKETRAPSP